MYQKDVENETIEIACEVSKHCLERSSCLLSITGNTLPDLMSYATQTSMSIEERTYSYDKKGLIDFRMLFQISNVTYFS